MAAEQFGGRQCGDHRTHRPRRRAQVALAGSGVVELVVPAPGRVVVVGRLLVRVVAVAHERRGQPEPHETVVGRPAERHHRRHVGGDGLRAPVQIRPCAGAPRTDDGLVPLRRSGRVRREPLEVRAVHCRVDRRSVVGHDDGAVAQKRAHPGQVGLDTRLPGLVKGGVVRLDGRRATVGDGAEERTAPKRHGVVGAAHVDEHTVPVRGRVGPGRPAGEPLAGPLGPRARGGERARGPAQRAAGGHVQRGGARPAGDHGGHTCAAGVGRGGRPGVSPLHGQGTPGGGDETSLVVDHDEVACAKPARVGHGNGPVRRPDGRRERRTDLREQPGVRDRGEALGVKRPVACRRVVQRARAGAGEQDDAGVKRPQGEDHTGVGVQRVVVVRHVVVAQRQLGQRAVVAPPVGHTGEGNRRTSGRRCRRGTRAARDERHGQECHRKCQGARRRDPRPSRQTNATVRRCHALRLASAPVAHRTRIPSCVFA